MEKNEMNTNKIYAESIVNQYSKKEETKVVQLKKLDREIKKPATIFAWIFGSVCLIVLGYGVFLITSQIGLELNSYIRMIIGILIGLVGLAGVSVNYPIYNKILSKSKEKHAGDILALADEIIKGE